MADVKIEGVATAVYVTGGIKARPATKVNNTC